MENISTYRSLLLDLSNSLTSSDLEQLKFLCRDVIPAGRAEKITRPFEFFSALEQLNMLSEENRDFLASKLIAVNRNDLRNKLLGIQGKKSNLLILSSTINYHVTTHTDFPCLVYWINTRFTLWSASRSVAWL